MAVFKKPPKQRKKKTTSLSQLIPKTRIANPENLLKIDDIFYNNKIKPELNNCEVGVPTSREFFLQEKSELGINATEKQKVEVIFDLIKVGGKLGIEYNSSERIPKTPDEVLKDRKGDCDELSLLLFLPLQKEQGFP